MLPNFCILGCGGVPFKWLLPDHRTLEGSSLPSRVFFSLSSFVSPLRPFGLGLLGRCDPRSLIFLRRYGRRSGQPSSSSLARRACVHYSGCSTFYCMASLVFVPLKFGYWLFLNFASAPGPFGGRWQWRSLRPLALPSFVARSAPVTCRTPDPFPFGPCTATIQRAPGHNRWGVSETTLPVKTQGRTLDCSFNFLPPRVAGWLLMFVAKCATGLRWLWWPRVRAGGRFKHDVESGLSVVVEWRFHSRQAGTTRRATNPQSGGHRPKKRLLRQVSPPGARGTVADGPSRYWCTYQRRCGNAGPEVLTRRAPPAGDRPKERRAPTLGLEGPTQGLAGANFLTMSVTASSSWNSADTCPRSRVAVVLWFGAWCIALGSLLLFPSLSLFSRSPSDVVPVTFMPSSILFNSGRAEQFPKLFHSVCREVDPKPSAFSLPTDRNSPRD